MLYFLVNRTRPGLSNEDYAAMGAKMADFYANIPAGVRMLGEYAALDWSRNFTVIETESEAQLRALMAPFDQWVDTEVVPIKPTDWWAKQTEAAPAHLREDRSDWENQTD